MYHWWLPSFFVGTFYLTFFYIVVVGVAVLLLRMQPSDTEMVSRARLVVLWLWRQELT